VLLCAAADANAQRERCCPHTPVCSTTYRHYTVVPIVPNHLNNVRSGSVIEILSSRNLTRITSVLLRVKLSLHMMWCISSSSAGCRFTQGESSRHFPSGAWHDPSCVRSTNYSKMAYSTVDHRRNLPLRSRQLQLQTPRP
jgi:hypothetical protein